MNELLGTLKVWPEYSQVSIQAVGTQDAPVLETGEEKFVASAQCILVATRSDFVDGDIVDLDVEILRGVDADELGYLIFDGQLDVPSGRISIGSILSEDEDRDQIDIGGPGILGLRIFGDEAESPGRLVILLPRNVPARLYFGKSTSE